MADHCDYALLIFGLATVGFPIWNLSKIGTSGAYGIAAIICLLAIIAVTMSIMHYWRHY